VCKQGYAPHLPAYGHLSVPCCDLLLIDVPNTLCLQEWRSVIQEVTNFLHADVAMPVPRSPGSNVPFRHSLRAALNQAEVKSSPHKMLLHDAILVSYYTRQVRSSGWC
jgi:hypothetical protein